MFLAEYGRVAEKIIRAHSALGWEGRGYWGKVGSENGNRVKSGKLILGNPYKHWGKMGWGEKGVGKFPQSGGEANVLTIKTHMAECQNKEFLTTDGRGLTQMGNGI